MYVINKNKADLVENVITTTGGCGLHQLISCLIIHISRLSVSWTAIGMAFIGHNPGFFCDTMVVTPTKLKTLSFENMSSVGLCSLDETSKCVYYQFPNEMSTVVSEWDLVCEKKWSVGLITSLQMVGSMCGCVSAGYASDAYGRKPTFFAGLLSVVILNLVGYFSQSLLMYCVLRLLLGLSVGVVHTLMFLLIIEFLPIQWRSIVTAMPSASLSQAMFSLVCWQLQDWRLVHLATAAVGAPFLLAYWFLPESFRRLVTKRKFNEARKTVNNIAALNGRVPPDLAELFEEDVEKARDDKSHSFVELFKTADIPKVTISLFIAWFTLGFSFYGMIFGVNSLSGNLFLNLFLVTIIDAPLAVPAGILLNRFGRRKYCILAMSFSGVFATGVGALQYSGFLQGTHVTTGMALFAKMTCTCSLVGIRVYTLELYPTSVRATGYGFQNTVYRFASAVVPQVLTLNQDVAGTFYIITGILMATSAVVTFFLPETANKSLLDRITGAKDNSK